MTVAALLLRVARNSTALPPTLLSPEEGNGAADATTASALGQSIGNVAGVVVVPILAMTASCLLAIHRRPKVVLSVAFHYFAGGLVLAAIATELVPLLHGGAWWAALLGLSVAYAVVLGLGCIEEGAAPREGAQGSEHEREAIPLTPVARLSGAEWEADGIDGRLSRGFFGEGDAQAGDPEEVAFLAEPAQSDTIRLVSKDAGLGVTLQFPSSSKRLYRRSVFPVMMVMAVSCDALIDGLCLGVSSGVGVKEGSIVAVALTIEMAFTGAALACALNKGRVSGVTKVVTVVLVPQLMLLGGVLGAVFHFAMDGSGWLFVAGICFCIGVLLYLGTVELLAEAHELNEQLSARAQRLTPGCMFLGFVVPILLDCLLSPGPS